MAAETPLVPRSVRAGGLLLVLASLQFVVSLILVESRLPGTNLRASRVTALAGAVWPWGFLFDLSLIALGALAIVGVLLVWSAFDRRSSRVVGLFLLLAGAVAAIVEGALPLLGSPASAPALLWARVVGVAAVGVAFLVVPFAMHGPGRWRSSRAYTFLTAVVVLGCGGLYASGTYLGLGPGGLELLGLGAALLWLLVEGTHIALLHRFAPGLHVKVAAA